MSFPPTLFQGFKAWTLRLYEFVCQEKLNEFIYRFHKYFPYYRHWFGWPIQLINKLFKDNLQTYETGSSKHSIWTGHSRSSQQSNFNSQAFLNRIKICFNEIERVWKYCIEPDNESESIIIGSKEIIERGKNFSSKLLSTFVCWQD